MDIKINYLSINMPDGPGDRRATVSVPEMTGIADDRLPATADFDAAALASGRAIDPVQWSSDASLLGLVREASYLWGTVRDADANLYSVMRRVPGRPGGEPEAATEGRALGGRLLVLSAVGPGGEPRDAMRVRREAKDAVSSDALHRVPRPDGLLVAAGDDAGGRAMQLDLTVDTLSYREDGVLDLSGARAVPALQWYVPGPQAALLYLTQTWEVTGTVLGRPVRGFIFWEEAYMYPGGRLYVAKDPLHGAEYTSWYSWATRWDDGATEVGHFLIGGRSFGVGVIACSAGEVTAARQTTGAISLSPDRQWHEGIDYDLDGVAWRCEPDPRGHMELGPIPNPQQEGRIFRRDETRSPVVHMAWGETVPARVPPVR
jgi:hypothetical protein